MNHSGEAHALTKGAQPERHGRWRYRTMTWPDSDEPLLLVALPPGRHEARSAIAALADIDADYCRRLGFQTWDEDILTIPQIDAVSVHLDAHTLTLRIGGHAWLAAAHAAAADSPWLGSELEYCLLGLVFGDPAAETHPPHFTRFVTGLSRGQALVGQVAVHAAAAAHPDPAGPRP